MEESEEKPPPMARAQSAVSLGDGSVPSWPWPFQWSSLRALSYISPRAGAGQWSRMAESGENIGRCRRGHKGFSWELGLLQSRQLKKLEGTKRRRRRRSPHLPGAVPADSQILTRAVLKPEDIKAPKANRFELGSRCPSQWKSPRSSFRVQAGSTNRQQQRPKAGSVAKSSRALWGTRTPATLKQGEEQARGAGKLSGLKGHSSQACAILTGFSDSRAFSYRGYNYITEFLCKLLSFIN